MICGATHKNMAKGEMINSFPNLKWSENYSVVIKQLSKRLTKLGFGVLIWHVISLSKCSRVER